MKKIVAFIAAMLLILCDCNVFAQNNAYAESSYQAYSNTRDHSNKKRYEDVLSCLNKTAEAKVSEADSLFRIGRNMRKKGMYEEAMPYFYKAAKLEHSGAQTTLGCIEEAKGNYTEALQWFEKAAKHDEAEAIHTIGSFYAEGKGVKQDKKKALFYMEKAAKLGFRPAMTYCGFTYLFDDDNIDYYKAFYYLEKAAELDNPNAQLYLGRCYLRGIGCKKNKENAKMWLQKAALHNGEASSKATEILSNL